LGTNPRFSYHVAWPGIPVDEAEQFVAFWMNHGALPDVSTARARAAQVVMYARDGSGDIAAVCTAVARTPDRLAQPVYLYRSFVAPAWRGTRVVFRLLKQALDVLESYARERDWPCIGVLLELENPAFGRKGRRPVWPDVDFVYVGKSARGLECRVHWFREARLKTPS